MNAALLTGARALDLTNEVGFVTGKVLAELGVDVVKVERPGGDASRLIPPYLGGEPGVERSLYWRSYNTGKRGITLDIEQVSGQELFRKLVADVDFVLESFTPGYLEGLGLGYDQLREMNPKLVFVSVTPFGQNGPYSHYKGAELVSIAMSGVLNNTGYEDRAPIKESLDSGLFHAGISAGLGAVMAYYHVTRTGAGQHVDVSVQEVAASRLTSSHVAWDERISLARDGNRSQMGPTSTEWFWECKDGYLFWHMLGGAFGAPANQALSDWIDEYETDNPLREVEDWYKFDKAGISVEQWQRFASVIKPFFLRFTKDEIRAENMKRGTNATVGSDPQDLLDSEQLRSRGFWMTLQDPALGEIQAPKYFFKSSASENVCLSPAPLVGQDNADVFGDLLGLTEAEMDQLRSENVI